MLIKELLNKKVDYEVDKQTANTFSTSATIGGRIIKFVADRADSDDWDIEFAEHTDENDRKGTYKLSGSGNELEVFAMIKDSILELIQRYHPARLIFTADKDNGSGKRGDTYERLIKRFKIPGYSYDRSEESHGFIGGKAAMHDQFVIVRN
jgi:hypothetical protein